jgi:fructose-1,6-bisphosphatase I
MANATLDAHLASYCAGGDEVRERIAETIRALSKAAVSLRATLNEGAIGGFAAAIETRNADGDAQRLLDIHADDLFLGAARAADVGLYCSEELDTVVAIDPGCPIALAIDPLDGSSNIDTNSAIGTIFGILPVLRDGVSGPEATFLQPGRNQLAAGFFIYGPQLALALTLGNGTHIFVFSQRLGTFVEAHASLSVPARTREFAINASNYRHWDEAVRLYVDDCLKGEAGPREKDFNMRWTASLVAEAYRILMRGGVFLYPADERKGYGSGRLRLVYEANPIAMLMEQAGGAASDTVSPILDLQPGAIHQRVPLVFGASREVTRIGRYHSEPSVIAERSPLFGNRGLFRV